MGRKFRFGIVALVAVAALGLASCDWRALVNPPVGGGEVTTETFQLGPYDLGPGQDREAVVPAPRPSGDFGIVGMRFRVVDENGTVQSMMDGIHLHHILLLNNAHEDPFCTGRVERFGGTGMELTPTDIPAPYAYLVKSTDSWSALFHLMNNSTSGGVKHLRIEYDIMYQRGANASTVRPVEPLFMDVTGCGNSEFTVPGTGSPAVYTKARNFVMPADGIAVGAGAHFHQGGITQRLISPRETWCDEPGNYEMGHLMTIPTCKLHNRVVAGDVMRVETDYHNDTRITGAMGIEMLYVWWGNQ
jgi:hypothetical protein